MRRFFIGITVFILIAVVESSGEERELDCRTIVDKVQNMEGGLPVDNYDSNGDGKIDYLEKLDEDGNKIMEIMDFNHDGMMDDFYFYTDGIITLREIDSNFDRRIDVWVYIKDGNYIEKYERDLDYNGSIDQVKNLEMKNKWYLQAFMQ